MAEEKQQLSLSDLGLEKEETPAMKVANQKASEKKEEAKNNNTIVVDGTEPIEQVVVSKPAKKPVSYAPVHNNEPKDDENTGPRVLKPDYENFRTVEDVNEIAKIKYDPTDKYVKSVRKNQQNLMELADKGIERTVKEMTAPGGRINQAKHEYVKHKYAELIKRSKNSKQLAEKIKALQNIMDSDARFDDASDYEKQGFVLWRIANDDTVETNDDYFGIKANKEAQKQRMVRNSHDARLELDKLNEEPMEDIYDDSKTFSVSSNDPVIPFKDTKKNDKKVEEKDTSITLEESPTVDTELVNDEEEKKETKSDITPDIEIDDSFEDDEDFQLTDDEQKKIIDKYKGELEVALGINKLSSLDGFSISSKSIKLNNALEGGRFKKTTTWGLQFAAEPIEMTALSGEELITLNPQQTAYDTVAGLRTVLPTIYRHIANPKKPEFETWLKQLSDYDVDSLLFAVYVANFKDTNIVTYQCPNKKCQNVFVKKLDVMDMLKFPNDEVKEKFLKVLKKDTEGTNLYKTHPVAINDRYAFGFVTQSAYSSLFEPASLSEEFSKKYKPIIDIMPNIDTIYKIDQVNRTLIPISFGEGNNFQNTVMRKVKGITTIMKSFTPDERAIVVSEAGKISLAFSTDKIQYCIPETTCTHCGETIPETTATPLDLLFTRAQLPIIAASIQE